MDDLYHMCIFVIIVRLPLLNKELLTYFSKQLQCIYNIAYYQWCIWGMAPLAKKMFSP